MDLDQLTAFERVAREGSFSRAAWALGLAQPTISARVKALEGALGGALFTRGGRGTALTDLGAGFLPYARRALELLDLGAAEARQALAGRRGQVSIGVLESLSGSFLGPALAAFHAERPEVDLLVRAGRHEQIAELLLDGVVGLALLAWPCRESLTLDLEPLLALREQVVLAAAPGHPLARGRPVTLDQLAEARPFLVLRWWLTLPAPLAQLAQRVQPTIDVPMDTGRQLVLAGAAVGFFPWMQVAEALAAGQLRAIPVQGMPPLTRESALVRRADQPLTPAAEGLVATLRARAAQLELRL